MPLRGVTTPWQSLQLKLYENLNRGPTHKKRHQ